MIFREVFADVFSFELLVAGAVFTIVVAAVAFAAARSRKRSGDTRRRDSHPVLELGYAVLLGGIAAVIAFISLSANGRIQDATATAGHEATPAARVDVTAFQWCWRFTYHDPDKSVTGVCGEHDTGLPTLVVPTGRPVQIRLTSSDVIHSFWVPDLGVKVDAFPDHTNSVTLTFDQEGRWLGRCAEYCGSYHPSMHFYVRAVSPEKYQQWLQHVAQA